MSRAPVATRGGAHAASPQGRSVSGEAPYLLEFRGVSRSFPGVRALREVDFGVRAGDVHALLGENGAGKSTIVNLIGGVFEPDGGEIVLAGEPVRFTSPRDSLAHGIALIHQELTLLPDLSVAENVFVGRLPRRRSCRVDWGALRGAASEVLARVGLDVDPARPVRSLSTGEQQQVEIARAISTRPRLLVMDEPTSALSEQEVERLFAVVRRLRDEGLTVIFISHRLSEIRDLTDRLTVLREGDVVLTEDTKSLSPERLAEAMVGRPLRYAERTRTTAGEPALELQGAATDQIEPVDLIVRHGEVVGVAGTMGAGKTELLRAVYGADPLRAGELRLEGVPVRVDSPARAVQYGVYLVPEDRKGEGLALGMSVADNVTLPRLSALTSFGFLSRGRQEGAVRELVDRLAIRTSGVAQPVRTLSGGNQQKVVLARWLSMNPRVLLLDQPTRGLDLSAKEDVYALVRELAEAGVAIVFVATELSELPRVCDRILVMRERRKVAELDGHACSEHDIFLAAVGEDS